jgi:hypothetical protein
MRLFAGDPAMDGSLIIVGLEWHGLLGAASLCVGSSVVV